MKTKTRRKMGGIVKALTKAFFPQFAWIGVVSSDSSWILAGARSSQRNRLNHTITEPTQNLGSQPKCDGKGKGRGDGST